MSMQVLMSKEGLMSTAALPNPAQPAGRARPARPSGRGPRPRVRARGRARPSCVGAPRSGTVRAGEVGPAANGAAGFVRLLTAAVVTFVVVCGLWLLAVLASVGEIHPPAGVEQVDPPLPAALSGDTPRVRLHAPSEAV